MISLRGNELYTKHTTENSNIMIDIEYDESLCDDQVYNIMKFINSLDPTTQYTITIPDIRIKEKVLDIITFWKNASKCNKLCKNCYEYMMKMGNAGYD